MLKKLSLILSLALALIAAENIDIQPQTFKVKFWKVPNLTNLMFINETKDKEVFDRWSYADDKSPFRFFSSIADTRAVEYITLAMQTECDKERKTYSCITRDLSGRDFSMRQYAEDFGKIFLSQPKAYVFDKKLGIIALDLANKTFGESPSLELRNQIDKIPYLVRYLSEVANISPAQILVIGNFGVNSAFLKKKFKDIFDVLISEPDTIINNNGKLSLGSSQNILVLKNSPYFKKGIVRKDILKFKKISSIKDEIKYLNEKVSPYYPIEAEIEMILNHKVR